MSHDHLSKPTLWGLIRHPQITMDRIKDLPLIFQPLSSILIIYLISSQLATMVIEQQLYPEQKLEYHVFNLNTLMTSFWIALFTIAFSALLFFMITQIFQTGATWITMLSLSIHLFLINTLGMVMQAIARFTPITSEWASLSVTAWMDTDFQSINLFTIWALILTAIGLQRVGNLPTTHSWITAIIFYVGFWFII